MRSLRSFAAAVLLAAASSVAGAPLADVKVANTSFPSGGYTIHVERFDIAGGTNHPHILVLHGAGGTLFDGPEMRRVARALAANGNTVDVIHYFNRTGSFFARDAAMQENFDVWLQTIRDAVKWSAGDRHEAVGIYGYSLGAFLAVAAASDNPEVGAIVEQAGGIWNNRLARVNRMPPVLIIHGQMDERVPVAKYEQPLRARLTGRSPHLERRIFPGEAHVFSQTAMEEVKPRVVRFFAANLARRR